MITCMPDHSSFISTSGSQTLVGIYTWKPLRQIGSKTRGGREGRESTAKLKYLDSFHKTVSQADLFLAAVIIQPHLLEL